MGQPTPPGENIPLYEGLGAEWNDIVGALPEDRRNELAPLLKQRIDERIKPYEPLKEYEDFHKSGINSDQIGAALNLYSIIENNPKEVYDTIGKHLGLTAQQTKEAVEEMQDMDEDDPRIATMQQQIDTLAQIALAQREQTTAEKEAAAQEAQLEKELGDLKKKYGDSEVDEEEILMRMLHKNMSAEEAYQEYSGKVSELRKRRPSPMIMGGGGTVPRQQLDVRKLDGPGTKNLVAQMLEHAKQQNQ